MRIQEAKDTLWNKEDTQFEAFRTTRDLHPTSVQRACPGQASNHEGQIKLWRRGGRVARNNHEVAGGLI